MADLGKTNAQWTRFFREFGLWIRMLRESEELRRRTFRERVQIENLNDVTSATPHFTAMTLTGVDYGTNTAEDGRLYVRIVANASNWDIHLYTATGATGEVAQAINVAASAQGTLTAVSSSGLTGTVTLGATIVAETDDKHQVLVEVDWKLEQLNVFPSDGDNEDDAFSRSAHSRMLNDLTSQALSYQSRIVQGFSEWFLSASDNVIARGNEFLEENQSANITETVNTDSDGAVTRTRTGLLEALRAAMLDETTGAEQDIIQRVTAGGAGVFDTNNDGQGTVASHTPEDHAPVGAWRFTCVAGLGTGDGGRERFDGTFNSASDDESFTFSDLTVKQSWKGPRGFGPITLLRSLTKTGDGTNVDVGNAASHSTTGELETNTDNGVIYGRVDANGANWDYSYFKSSNRATGDLVAKATNVAASATNVTLSAKNGSGLTVVIDAGTAPTDTNTWSIDLNFFSVQNTSDVPDKFSVATTLTSEGKASRILALIPGLQYKLNGETAGAEQIDDDLMAGANTRLQYLVEDV